MYYIIYHGTDNDGIGSAALVYFHLLRQQEAEIDQISLIPAEYGMNIMEKIDLEEAVSIYMVDFCLPYEKMKQLNECGAYFSWIDHHAPAVKSMEQKGFKPNLLKSTSYTVPSACELTWYALFGDIEQQKEKPPKAVQFISEADTHTVRYNDSYGDDQDYWESDVVPFKYGIEALLGKSPVKSKWMELFELGSRPSDEMMFMNKVKEQGKVIREVQREQLIDLYRNGAIRFTWEFEGTEYDCVAVNTFYTQSDLWPVSIYPEGIKNTDCPDLFINWFLNAKGRYRIGFARPDGSEMDVSSIAKNLGGGGHPGKAGVTMTDLPFQNKMINAVREKE